MSAKSAWQAHFIQYSYCVRISLYGVGTYVFLTAHMHDLTGFQRDLLLVIAGDDTGTLHGLAIKDEIEDYYGTEIHHGRLYPNLDTLSDKGLVDKRELDRRTNSYHLTQRGEREIISRREWVNERLGAINSDDHGVLTA